MLSNRPLRPHLWIGLCLICSQASAFTAAPPVQEVHVHACVMEQDTKSLRTKVIIPITKALDHTPGITHITGTIAPGSLQIQVAFANGASRTDKASVEEALKRLAFAPDAGVLSVHVELAHSRKDIGFADTHPCPGEQAPAERR